jgi:hypothetical protein
MMALYHAAAGCIDRTAKANANPLRAEPRNKFLSRAENAFEDALGPSRSIHIQPHELL